MSAFSPPQSPHLDLQHTPPRTPASNMPPKDQPFIARPTPSPHTPASSEGSDEFRTPESTFGSGSGARVWSGDSAGGEGESHSKESSSNSSLGNGHLATGRIFDPSKPPFQPSTFQLGTPLDPGPLLSSLGKPAPVASTGPSAPRQLQQGPTEDDLNLNMSSLLLQDWASHFNSASPPARPAGQQMQQQTRSPALGVVFTSADVRSRSAFNDERRRQEIQEQLSRPVIPGTGDNRTYSPYNGGSRVGSANANARATPPHFHHSTSFEQPSSSQSSRHPENEPSSPPFRDAQPLPSSRPIPTNGTSRVPNGGGTSASIYAPKAPYTSQFAPENVKDPSASSLSNARGATEKIKVVVSPRREAWEIAAEQSRMRASAAGIDPGVAVGGGLYGLGIDTGLGYGVLPERKVDQQQQQRQFTTFVPQARERSSTTPTDRSGPLDIARGPSRYSQAGRPFSPSSLSSSPGPTYFTNHSSTPFPQSDTNSPSVYGQSPPPPPANNGFSDPYMSALLSALAAQQQQNRPASLAQPPPLSPLIPLPGQSAEEKLSADQDLLTKFRVLQHLHPGVFGTHSDNRGIGGGGGLEELRNAAGSLPAGFGGGASLGGGGLGLGAGYAGLGGALGGGGALGIPGVGNGAGLRELLSLNGLGPGMNPVVMDPSLQRYLLDHNLPLDGPSPTNKKAILYKTELCRSWEKNWDAATVEERCVYGGKCQYAHGREELRPVDRHPKYKTQICTTFWLFGGCAYGSRCCFLHNDIPVGGIPELGDLGTQAALKSILQARMDVAGVTPEAAPLQSPNQNFSQLLSQQNYFQSSSAVPDLSSLSPLGHNHPLPFRPSSMPSPSLSQQNPYLQQQQQQRDMPGQQRFFPVDGPGRSSDYATSQERERERGGLLLRTRDRSDSLSVNMNPIPELTSIPPLLPRSSSFGGGREDQQQLSSYNNYNSNGRGGFHAPRSASFPDSFENDEGSYPQDQLFPSSHASRSASLNEGLASYASYSGHPSRSPSVETQHPFPTSSSFTHGGGRHASRSTSDAGSGSLASRWAPPASLSSPSPHDPVVPAQTSRSRSSTVPWGSEDVGAIGERSTKRRIW